MFVLMLFGELHPTLAVGGSEPTSDVEVHTDDVAFEAPALSRTVLPGKPIDYNLD